jgi:hypothetical protein
LFNLFRERRKKTAKQKEKAKATDSADLTEEIGDVLSKDRDIPILEDVVDKEEAADIKAIIIYALNEIADLHERVRKCVPFSYMNHIPFLTFALVYFFGADQRHHEYTAL